MVPFDISGAQGHLYQESLRRLVEMFPPPPAIRIQPSASIIPWRTNSTGQIEVFWVRRSPSLGVLGGWHAFPGGRISKSDALLPVEGAPVVSADYSTSLPLYDVTSIDDDLSSGIVGGALRELFEEVGLLVTSPRMGWNSDQLEHGRRAAKTEFAKWLAALDARLDASSLVFAGRWITPPMVPFRFDTRFFLLEWRPDEHFEPQVDGEELSHGEWVRPADALARWHAGTVMAAPPTLFVLDVLASEGPRRGLARLVQHGREPLHPIQRYLEGRPGIIGLPLFTPTLPPARETTSYLLGKDRTVLVDVGSPFDSEISRLAMSLDYFRREFHKPLEAIWLTHHHPDHLWGVEKLRQFIDVPVCAHEDTAQRAKEWGVRVDTLLKHGQKIPLASDGSYTVEVVHTPGHAKGHLSFWNEAHRSLIAGDLVAGRGTILIDPPDGDMDEYLESLERVRRLGPQTIFPAHGPVIQNATDYLESLIQHRLLREDLIRAGWETGIRDLAQLVRHAYPDVDEQMHPFAERQALAHLIRLDKGGALDAASPGVSDRS